ncbi:Phage Mu protein F like protein [[Luteovulum] sphaeroides subsp. megalophilum]|uniref:phage head morphogenesis protein n=1 Tax=Cereibacter sphaeroides TaxID=1063 RepID=UPI000B6C79F4|nr:phage minor head protein [Cereibacter sphaeroides]SNS86902.1 Phage Mu protein F like protein [[Luteovulum] sphaeroides subsp. megalophilum]
MSDLAAVFRRPFPEQVAAFRLRLRNLVPTARWDDIRRAQHDRAFMVAGALKADLLADLAAAVDKAVSQGGTLEDFRRDFRAIVESRGWHGWTGEGTAKGEAWRTKVIYRTNMATTYAAGRLAQLVAGNFSYWVYRHGGSREPRIQHLSWNGVALPPDHPFWQTHAPPNGWGCSCYIVGARTEAGIRRVGGDPAKKLPEDWDALDARTGAPAGIDKGWDYAPGASAVQDLIAMAAEKSVDWPAGIAKAHMASLPPGQAEAVARSYRALPSLAQDLRRWAERVQGERNGAPIAGPVQIEPLRTLGLVTQSARPEGGLDLTGVDFAIAAEDLVHILGASSGRTPSVEDLGRLAALLDRATEVREVKGAAGLLDWIIRTPGEEWTARFELRDGSLFLVELNIGGSKR